MPDESPQVLYDSSLPEAQGNEESNKERTPSLQIVKHGHKWLWIVIALVVTAAIAVGVAVGVWRHREHSPTSNSSSPIVRYDIEPSLFSSLLTPIARRHRKITLFHPLGNLFLTIHL